MQQLRVNQHKKCYGLSYKYGILYATVADRSISTKTVADLATIIVCHMQQLRISQHENCYGLSYNYGLSHATVASESARPKLLWTPSAS